MPADNRLRLDDHQDLPPTRPQPRQDDPEKAIGHPKRWPMCLSVTSGNFRFNRLAKQLPEKAIGHPKRWAGSFPI